MKKIISVLLSFLLGALGVVIIWAVIGALTLAKPLPEARPAIETVEPDGYAERFAKGLTMGTVSSQLSRPEVDAQFSAFIGYIKSAYPRTFAACTVETHGHSQLITWAGKSRDKEGLLLLAHFDVVPAESTQWPHPPFGAVIKDDVIWGRGAMDFKLGVFGIIEAMELLLAEGFQPEADIVLALGHDEEIGGRQGAALMAASLRKQGKRFSMVLDEGLAVTQGLVPGIDVPVALIGVAEKGYASFTLTAKGQGGHTSMPERRTAAGRLGEALYKIETTSMPASIEGPAAMLFEQVGPYMNFSTRLAIANQWLLGGVLLGQLAKKPSTNALINTTLAITMLEGSPKDNVLPTRARAVLNARIRPGHTKAEVMSFLKRTVGAEIEVEPYRSNEGTHIGFASNPSSVSARGRDFDELSQTILKVFPTSIVAPSLVLGATDSRHYKDLSDHIYRFMPMPFSSDDRHRIHGIGERLSKADLSRAITFYKELIMTR